MDTTNIYDKLLNSLIFANCNFLDKLINFENYCNQK